MKILLDSHSLVWFVTDASRLPAAALAAILDSANVAHVSPASFFELAIKHSLGKLRLAVSFEDFVERVDKKAGLQTLQTQPEHALELAKLPFHHRDPFDRILVSQAMAENMPIISADVALDFYGIRRMW
jgi:PIN domain nuclease of toxin-antitoxin system